MKISNTRPPAEPRRPRGRATTMSALALATVGALALSACSEQPYPQAAPDQATAAPPAPPEALAGAPEGGPPPSTRTPQYVPPPPPPGGYAPYQPGMQGPPPPPPYGAANGGPGQIVTMAPIPNPPEDEGHVRGWGAPRAHRHHHRLWLYGQRAAPSHHHVHAYARPMPPQGRQAAPVVAPPSQFAKPQPLEGRHRGGVDRSMASAAAGAPVHPGRRGAPSNGQGQNGQGQNGETQPASSDRLQALQGALHDAFQNEAVLNVPALTTGQPAIVTLQIPSDFAQAVRDASAQKGLPDASAGMNLNAALSGDGYTITPQSAQAAPLTAGQATVFQWQVTPNTAAHTPLKASASAVSGATGQTFALGDKAQGSGGGVGRVVGIGILALIVLGLIGWAARRRPRPKPMGATKPRPAYDSYPPRP